MLTSPVKKSHQSSRAPLHVYLRTQQRRLRHVRSLCVRNLATPEHVTLPLFPLDIKLRFTLHRTDNSNIALYSSNCIQETYNPTWGSLLLDYTTLGENSILDAFVVKLWQVTDKSGEDILLFQKLIDLQNYKYLGLTMIRVDNASYSSNSVVVGMQEGYYVDTEVGGYPSPRRPSFHKIMDFLPPQSLIEVRKTEVLDSYTMTDLKRLMKQQEMLNKLRITIANDKAHLLNIRLSSEHKTKQSEESIELRTRCELLRKEIDKQKLRYMNEKKRLKSLKQKLDEKEDKLKTRKEEYLENTMKYDKHRQTHSQKRDLLIKTQRKMYLRQRVMIAELAETFCIREMNGTFTICGVILPNGDPTEGGTTQQEQVGVALGFVTHLVYLLGQFLMVPLQYTLLPNGSRSLVTDNVHEEQTINCKDFPLYLKGVEKSLFQFGLYLLWRDILQLRQHCGYSNSRSSTKKTLPNLKALLDRLVKDRYSVSPLSEMSPPSISITGPTVSNPSPRTASYYSATPEGQNSVSDDLSDKRNQSNMLMQTTEDVSSPSSSKDISPSAPVIMRSSPQVRRHQEGFVLKESLSPHSPYSLDNFQDDGDTLSQSPDKDGAIYAFNISRPLSNADGALMNLNPSISNMFSCSPMEIDSLPFTPSPPKGLAPVSELDRTCTIPFGNNDLHDETCSVGFNGERPLQAGSTVASKDNSERNESHAHTKNIPND